MKIRNRLVAYIMWSVISLLSFLISRLVAVSVGGDCRCMHAHDWRGCSPQGDVNAKVKGE
jgi:hypothetical protein